MYSPFVKFGSFVLGVLFLLAGGSSVESGDVVPAVLGVTLGFALILWYGSERKKQGAQPLTSLKPGREYRIEGVLPSILNTAGRRLTARLVLSWHVDCDHDEYRLAHLQHDLLTAEPRVGGGIRSDKPRFGYVAYVVTLPSGLRA